LLDSHERKLRSGNGTSTASLIWTYYRRVSWNSSRQKRNGLVTTFLAVTCYGRLMRFGPCSSRWLAFLLVLGDRDLVTFFTHGSSNLMVYRALATLDTPLRRQRHIQLDFTGIRY